VRAKGAQIDAGGGKPSGSSRPNRGHRAPCSPLAACERRERSGRRERWRRVRDGDDPERGADRDDDRDKPESTAGTKGHPIGS
jgi:hypothetical protein